MRLHARTIQSLKVARTACRLFFAPVVKRQLDDGKDLVDEAHRDSASSHGAASPRHGGCRGRQQFPGLLGRVR